MSIAVVLPSLGESVVEGTISQWLVKEGDRVERDQPLVEITTDKVDVEIPSPAAGFVQRIVASAGEVVPIGAELARIGTNAHPNRKGSAAVGRSTAAVTRSMDDGARASADSAAAKDRPSPPRVTPVARRVAEAFDVDVTSAPASGPGGRVTKRDVLAAAEHRSAQPQTPMPIAGAAGGGEAAGGVTPATRPYFASYEVQAGDRVIPLSPLRRLVAEHMVYSKTTSPHVGTVAEIDLARVVALREANKSAFREAHGFSLSYLPFIVYAAVRGLREYPALNASVLEDAIVEKADLHIGISVETENGLVVPVVRHADRLSVIGIAAAIEDLASRARSKRLSADELRGGTFTISNPGGHGNLYVDGADAIAIRPTMHLALSYDHRAVDGAPANAFLHRVRELLERAEFDL
jgi:2-oxoglutarate dehydrogenase E2 component (dihydrolipoamide succinyltransferase)